MQEETVNTLALRSGGFAGWSWAAEQRIFASPHPECSCIAVQRNRIYQEQAFVFFSTLLDSGAAVAPRALGLYLKGGATF